VPNIIKVNLADKLRTLLTDVLPYELPLWYMNHSMHRAFTDKLEFYLAVSGLKSPEQCPSQNLIPLDYCVFRGENKGPRVLSIMHPISQLYVCLFYEKYANLIEYYCSKSSKSLRFPYKVSTKFYGKLSSTIEDGPGIEILNRDKTTASSYFKYLKYPFLYRFFESYEYHKLEKRFSHMMQVDISKCFPSIYTHSIGWATKNKRLAKLKQKGSFDGDFDNLMQNTNYRETNGIIIGPEVSRVFSEIILQQLDLDIVKSLLQKSKLKDGVDYDFRRYVDDYFVFFRDESVGTKVFNTIGECLLEYKLHLNEAKTEYRKRPFTTNISFSKSRFRDVIANIYKERYSDEGVYSLNKPDWKANKLISRLKMALSTSDVEYHSVSNYIISAIRKRSISYLKVLSDVDVLEERHVNWVLVDLDVIFFIHAMDIRIRTTDSIARYVECVLSMISGWQENYRRLVYKKIFDLIRHAIDIFLHTKGEVFGLETLNLLVVISMLPDEYGLEEVKVRNYLDKLEEIESKDDFYFRWVTFMLFAKDNMKYSELKSVLIQKAVDVINSNHDGFNSTHFYLLFFDFCSCPFVERDLRVQVIENTRDKYSLSFGVDKQNYILANDFIAPWRDPDYLQNSLDRREFTFAYD